MLMTLTTRASAVWLTATACTPPAATLAPSAALRSAANVCASSRNPSRCLAGTKLWASSAGGRPGLCMPAPVHDACIGKQGHTCTEKGKDTAGRGTLIGHVSRPLVSSLDKRLTQWGQRGSWEVALITYGPITDGQIFCVKIVPARRACSCKIQICQLLALVAVHKMLAHHTAVDSCLRSH